MKKTVVYILALAALAGVVFQFLVDVISGLLTITRGV